MGGNIAQTFQIGARQQFDGEVLCRARHTENHAKNQRQQAGVYADAYRRNQARYKQVGNPAAVNLIKPEQVGWDNFPTPYVIQSAVDLHPDIAEERRQNHQQRRVYPGQTSCQVLHLECPRPPLVSMCPLE